MKRKRNCKEEMAGWKRTCVWKQKVQDEGMFLGYKVNTKGLKVCPDKVDAVLSLPSPKCLKDVQKLNGKLASLNRFLAKSAEKSLSFFKTLKKCTKKSDFHWTTKAEEAFKQKKQLITELPMLTASIEKEDLIVYLAAAKETDSPDTLMEVEEELPGPLILFTDGSSCTNGSRVGLIHTNPEGMDFTYALRFRQVPRSENKKADALSKMASTSFAHLSKQVLVKELKEKPISELEILAIVEEEEDTWMTPIFEYLTKETLPADVKKARAVKRKSQRFAIINGTIYKKSFLGPWLWCVGPLQANYVLREIHEGSCSMHAGTRSVVAKALMIGYYWPTMHKDASLGEGIKAARCKEKELDGRATSSKVDLTQNDEALGINLDLLQEKREQEAIREAKSKAKMEKYYNSKVRSASFKPGDLVYRNKDASRAKDTGKLGPK
nr:reverse transcriptase domain-containing protein [Tanacetum cinerariifolium]